MTGAIIIFLVYFIILFIGNRKENPEKKLVTKKLSSIPEIDQTDIVYNGITGSINPEEIESILTKRYQYYVHLEPQLKNIFLKRMQHFMDHKTFIIKSSEGFKEMPVLVSAAAIQLTFGLDEYLLPFYKYIRIYPQEYPGDGFLKVLAGNVHNNTITVAWNQFLKGNEDLTDGSNVGLHEMSHALYFQKLMIDGNYAKDFCRNYNRLLTACKEAYHEEITAGKNLYSQYADTDMQEFWAESVEIFFEKPGELSNQYPAVYEAMKLLLNQDPLSRTYPVQHRRISLSQRFLKILGYSKA